MFSKLLAGSTVALSIASTLAAGVQFAGVNIAGFDFGCTTDGTCTLSSVQGPITGSGGGSGDGPGQMKHFATDDKLNLFRLPVAWQYLVNGKLGGTLDATNFASYDKLVQACLGTGAHCIIDIHNYARWNGAIIGQSGGPTTDDFSGLWKQLATKYAADSNVVMGLMNEPHDMPDLSSWAQQVQAAVTAIRGAGATSQMILLPGNGYTGGTTFVSGGSAAALATVKNPDGSFDGLIFDIHQYFDSDNSGTHANCVTNHISDSFQPLQTWLKANNRQAILSESGGGSSDSSCLTDVCAALDFLNDNSAQFLGWVGWAAGSFQTSYVLSMVPNGATDVPLMKQCFAGKFGGGAGEGPVTVPVASSPVTGAGPLPPPNTATVPAALVTQPGSGPGAGPMTASAASVPIGVPTDAGAPILPETPTTLIDVPNFNDTLPATGIATGTIPNEAAITASNPKPTKSKPCRPTYPNKGKAPPTLAEAGAVNTGFPTGPDEAASTASSGAPDLSEAGETEPIVPSVTASNGAAASGIGGHVIPSEASMDYWRWLEMMARVKQHKHVKGCDCEKHHYAQKGESGAKPAVATNLQEVPAEVPTATEPSVGSATETASASNSATGLSTATPTATGLPTALSTGIVPVSASATGVATSRKVRRGGGKFRAMG